MENIIDFNCWNCRTSYEFEEVSPIGEGSEGTVFEAKHYLDRRKYAVKQIPSPEHRNQREKILNEARVLAALENEHLIRYYSCWEETNCPHSQFVLSSEQNRSKSYFYISTNIYRGGLLKTIIDEGRNTELHRRLRYAIEIVKGIRYLHKKNITHGDLHAGNVFLDDDDHIKIGDYGLALIHAMADSADTLQEFKKRKMEDITSLKKIVIELMVPFARNPTIGGETYGKDKRNFINQDIEAPDFDKDLKSHIQRLRKLIDADDHLLTAQRILDILCPSTSSIDNNNNMSTPMDAEKSETAEPNTETCIKQPIGAPMDVEGSEKTEEVIGASETPVKQEGNWFGWIATIFSTFSPLLCGILSLVIVILIIVLLWGVKVICQQISLIRKLVSTYDPIIKSVAVSASI